MWTLAASLVVASSVACRTPAHDERREALTFERLPPVDLRLQIDPRYDARATLAARRALTRLGDWLGAPPFQQLTIVPAATSAAAPSAVAVDTPWLASARGGALESEIVVGIARQFWDPRRRRSRIRRRRRRRRKGWRNRTVWSRGFGRDSRSTSRRRCSTIDSPASTRTNAAGSAGWSRTHFAACRSMGRTRSLRAFRPRRKRHARRRRCSPSSGIWVGRRCSRCSRRSRSVRRRVQSRSSTCSRRSIR